MFPIDRDAYLRYSFELKPAEIELSARFQDWLPDEIIDCHTHITLPEHVESMDERTYRHMLSTFPSFTLEESQAVHEMFYPGKQVHTVRFAKTYRGINHRQVNRYLLDHVAVTDRIALYGLADDIHYTISMMAEPRISALKIYYSYLSPPATEIYQYFPPEVLEEAQGRDLPIILHPPTNLTTSGHQVIQLQQDFPRLRIIIAHLGLSKLMIPGLAEAFAILARSERTYMDTSMNPSGEVVTAAITCFGTGRILFGTDEPLSLIRSAAYIHPTLGERLITEYPYHWVDQAEHQTYANLASNVVHAHWQQLEAIKQTVDSLSVNEKSRLRMRFSIGTRQACSIFDTGLQNTGVSSSILLFYPQAKTGLNPRPACNHARKCILRIHHIIFRHIF